MNKMLLVASTVISAFSFSALAADLPSRKAPATAAIAAPASWTGFYAGVNAGYGWGNAKFSIAPGGNWVGDPDWARVNTAASKSKQISGALGGIQFGYNYQVGSIVYGIEADVSASGARGNFATATANGAVTGTYSAKGSAGSDWIATLRPRVGFTSGSALFFVTGGLAVANNHFSSTVNYLNVNQPSLPVTTAAGGANAGSNSGTNTGWTLGTGLEWAVSSSWSVKAEYLYVDLGKNSASSRFVSAGNWDMTHSERKNLNIVRLGLNYRF